MVVVTGFSRKECQLINAIDAFKNKLKEVETTRYLTNIMVDVLSE